jgi:hypothetical protein
MLMERHVDGNSQNSKLTNHPTTSHHNRTLCAMPPLTLTFEQGLFIASIGKTMTSKDGEKNFRSLPTQATRG